MVETNSRAWIGPAMVRSSFRGAPVIDQDVRPARGDALILDHIIARHADLDLVDVFDRMGGVAHVLVEEGTAGPLATGSRRIEGQRPPGLAGRSSAAGPSRGPGVVGLPLVRAGLEDPGLGEAGRSLALQVILEERELDVFAIELGRLGVERHGAQRCAVAARPAAVAPGPHHQHVGRPGAGRLDVLVGLERAEEVLGVEPAADGHDGRLDVLQVRGGCCALARTRRTSRAA